MIVVVGLPAYVGSTDGSAAAVGGLAADVAAAARARGSQVELVGKVGDDGPGDAVVVALGRAGIGHAALLRDPTHPTPVVAAAAASQAVTADSDSDDDNGDEPSFALLPEDPALRPSLDAGDVDLALKYLPGARVIVIADTVSDAAISTAAEAAAYAGARLIVLLPAGTSSAAAAASTLSLPPEATVLEAQAGDDGSFARVVGAFAAGLEAGAEPAAAFTSAVESSGWELAAG